MGQQSLVTDIGGTNARFALFDIETGEMSAISKVIISPNDTVLSLIQRYLQQQTHEIKVACIAIAGPIHGDKVMMTNNNLSFSCRELKRQLNFEKLIAINDFMAVSTCVPKLTAEDVVQIGGGKPNLDYPIAVYGAGTGLGVAHLIKFGNQWTSFSGEGGHVEMPMVNEIEDKVLDQVRQKYGRVSAEHFLSGSGIVNIYNALLILFKKPEEEITPDIIVRKALDNSCQFCYQTLMLFCQFMGRFGGNLALTLNTQGGVFIAGGIVPRFIDFLKASPFRSAFESKGFMSYLMQQIPVYVIIHENPGLLGAGIYLQNSQQSI